MSSNYCNYECDQSNCPFKTDPLDRYREVCVKCGKEYSFRRGRAPVFLIICLISAILILMDTSKPQTDNQPKTQPFPELRSDY